MQQQGGGGGCGVEGIGTINALIVISNEHIIPHNIP